MYIKELNRYMISYDELIDYLIYHCPLRPTTKTALTDLYERRMGLIRDYPLMVMFYDPQNNREYTACESEPLKVYTDLASLIWWQTDTMKYITKLYYES